MADKPPIAPKPGNLKNAPVPKPRKKGPPPLKPVPYLKHKEHKQYEVMTFKSNHPIKTSTEKPPPPQPLEKPPRRYSAKGEPSAEFYKPKSKEKNPIQYTVPSVPGRLLKDSDQGSMIANRPRLNTPIVPTEPPQHVLSNGSTLDKIDTSSVEPARPPQDITDENANGAVNGVHGDIDGPLYREAYDHVQVEREEIEAYAIVSPTRKAALPEPRPRLATPLSPPSISPKPTSTIKDQNTWSSISPTSTSGSEVPQETTTENEAVDGYSIVPPIVKRHSSERMKRSQSPSPSPHLSSAPPFPPQPTGPNEYSVTVHSTSPAPPLSPSPVPRSNQTVDTVNADEYSLLDRPDHSNPSPQAPSPSVSKDYSPLEVEDAVVPLAGNPTQQGGYSRLQTSVPNDEYEVVTPEPLRKFKTGQDDLSCPVEVVQVHQHPKAKARRASQKIKDGSVQLQSARDRSELISYNSADKLLPDSPLTHKESANKSLPLPKLRRPRTSPETTSDNLLSCEPVATDAHATTEHSTGADGYSHSVPDQMLEQAGYETFNTFSPEPDMYIDSSFDDDDDSEAIEDVRTVQSPKVELDIDHIVRIRSALDNADTAQDMSELRKKKRYENQMVIDSVAQEYESKGESSQPEYVDPNVALSSPDMFTVPQHAVPGPLGYCAIDVCSSVQPSPESSDIVGAGVVKGDKVEVHHHSYPNAEGYCDLGVSGTSPSTNGDLGSDLSRVDEQGYSDIVGIAPAMTKVSDGLKKETEQDVGTDAKESSNVGDESFTHTYDVISVPTPKTRRTIPEPPKTKPKPKKDTGGSPPSNTVCDLEGDDKHVPSSSSKKMPLDVPGKLPRKPLNAPRRRAPPPPPLSRSRDDSLVGSPKKNLPDNKVTGAIATLPRGQSLTTSLKTTKSSLPSPKRAFSSDFQSSKQPVKSLSVKQLAENELIAPSPPASPRADFPSPSTKKRTINIFSKLRTHSNNSAAEMSPSGSPNFGKKKWRKKSLREKGHHEAPGKPMSAADKTKSLPATGRILQKPLVLPSLDPFEDDDESGIYSTITETKKKPPLLPPAASPAHFHRTTVSLGLCYSLCIFMCSLLDDPLPKCALLVEGSKCVVLERREVVCMLCTRIVCLCAPPGGSWGSSHRNF